MSQITLYTAKVCPYAHRVELALAEVGVPFTRFEIDLQHKPEWYAPNVNPASKVPAIAYGGPPVPADQPSPESTKLAESLVLLQFIPDLFPTASTLLPADPVTRAKARFFIETFSSTFSGVYYAFVARGDEGAEDKILAAIDGIVRLKEKEGGRYAVSDEFTIADAAVLPFFARAEVNLREDLGNFEDGRGRRLWETLQREERYQGFREYFGVLKERESFKKTFWPDEIVAAAKKRLGRA